MSKWAQWLLATMIASFLMTVGLQPVISQPYALEVYPAYQGPPFVVWEGMVFPRLTDDGKILGAVRTGDRTYQAAVFFRGGWTLLSNPLNSSYTFATAGSSGQVVGVSAFPVNIGYHGEDFYTPLLWNAAGEGRTLPTRHNWWNNGVPMGINKDGTTIVGFEEGNKFSMMGGQIVPLVWTGGSVRQLPVLTRPWRSSWPYYVKAVAVSQDGVAVGFNGVITYGGWFYADRYQAVAWTPTGDIQALENPPGFSRSGFSSYAHDISGRGQYIAGGVVDNRWVNGAVVWKDYRVFTLPSLETKQDATALAVNDAGQIVGRSGTRAVIWKPIKLPWGIRWVVHDLNGSVFPPPMGRSPIPPPPAAEWILVNASSINNRGQIAGIARNDKGKEAAFILTPIGPVFELDL